MFINNVILQGNVASAVKTYAFEKSTKYSFSVETKKTVRKKDGTTVTISVKNSVDYFSPVEMSINEGDLVTVVGELSYDKWTDKSSGEVKYKTLVKAQSVQLTLSGEDEEVSLENIPL